MLKDAIPLQFGFELVVRNDGLVPPFGYGGQIIQIFEKLLVICNRKHNGGASVLGGSGVPSLGTNEEIKAAVQESREMPLCVRAVRSVDALMVRCPGSVRGVRVPSASVRAKEMWLPGRTT